MRSFRKILVAIKNPAARAPTLATKAAQIAKAVDGELELFHALDIPIFVDALAAEGVPPRAYVTGEEKRAVAGLERIAARLRRHGVRVTTRAAWDFPAAEAIVRRATALRADLIVQGRHHGRHTLAWLLGLTDWNVLRTSPVPVLLVKTPRLYRRPAVLAAIDPLHAFAKPARLDAEILQVGKRFARSLGGTLHAMHAYLPIPYPEAPGAGRAGTDVTADLLEAADRAARNRFRKALAGSTVSASHRYLVNGHPVETIPRTARRIRGDIVVMGAISRSGLKRLFIGNTAERVLDRLTCDVLVVKPHHFGTRVQRTQRGPHIVPSALPIA